MKQKRNKLINIINVLRYELCNKTVFETIKSINLLKNDMCNKKFSINRYEMTFNRFIICAVRE